MWPDQVSNPGSLAYESGVLPIALRGPASRIVIKQACSHALLVKCIRSPRTQMHLPNQSEHGAHLAQGMRRWHTEEDISFSRDTTQKALSPDSTYSKFHKLA